jgi:glycosyltransferase involved in cell wall biosynthesis
MRALTFLRAAAQRSEWAVSLIVFDAAPAARPDLPVRIVPDRYHARGERLADRLCDLFRPVSVNPEIPLTGRESRAWGVADAAVYVSFGIASYTAKLAAWCRQHGRKCVLVAGSDADFDVRYQSGDQTLNPYGSRFDLCRYAIDHADAIVCQTGVQARLLEERFGRRGIVVRNPVEMGAMLTATRRHALWLGKTDRVKRPELFVELSRLCSEVPCVLVANPSDRQQYEALVRDAPANLSVRESVPREALDALIAESFCVVNTSVFEGFPNAFLDAARQAVPVLALDVDPDGSLAKSGGGISTGGDLLALAGALRHLHAAPDEARQMGGRWRAYAAKMHEPSTQIGAFMDVLQQVVASPAPAAQPAALRLS